MNLSRVFFAVKIHPSAIPHPTLSMNSRSLPSLLLQTLAVFALLVGARAHAADIPAIVKEGFEEYRSQGVEAAADRWLRGSAFDGNPSSKLSILQGAIKIEAVYGKPESFEVLASFTPAERLRRIYVVSYHEKSPVFARFDLYSTERGWIVYDFVFNTESDKIVPAALFDRNREVLPPAQPASP